jgi:hypothetical protein
MVELTPGSHARELDPVLADLSLRSGTADV